ncbi:MAG: GNAT family N-acetyltransferase [Myxococcales bacterium]|nr:GNAT family N-acetyltransferase [Myxococcales bacterium]
MAYDWVREHVARWDDNKQRIIGRAGAGVFDSRYAQSAVGATLPGEWWRVENDGTVVGYGWLDAVWGDAEILLAADPEYRGKGVGTFALDHLAAEAASRGLNYIYNIVRPTHPHAAKVTAWLVSRGFSATEDGRLMRLAGARSAPPAEDGPGTIGWHDLTVADAEGVRDFYCAVAGWKAEPLSMGDYDDYVMKTAAGHTVGGICHARGPNAYLPSTWMLYIRVEDVDAAVAAAEKMGGEILARPGEQRPYAIVRDPAGAAFALWPAG